jgi:hypothetical protein
MGILGVYSALSVEGAKLAPCIEGGDLDGHFPD